MTGRHLQRTDWLIILLLAGVSLGLYVRTARFDFVNYDDDQYVFENHRVKSGLTVDSIRWAFTTGYASNWHPLTWISHMLDVELFGPGPGGMHVTNTVLHAANAALLFAALFHLTGHRWPAAACAAIFALHPQRVESVAWISERKDVLSGLFFMLTLLAYARYARRPSRATFGWVLAALVGGLLSKPMLVTLPCVLFLLDCWPLNRVAGRQQLRCAILEKLPMLALCAASAVATYWAQSAGRAVSQLKTIPLSARINNAIVAYVEYLYQSVWPAKLAVFYPHPYSFPGGSIEPWRVATCAAALLAMTVTAVGVRRRMPWVLVGWLWYLGMLVPVIGLVQVGSQSHADRYTYLPLIGIMVAVAWTVREFVQVRPLPGNEHAPRHTGKVAGVMTASLVAGVLAGLAMQTHRQIGVWRNSETLMRHAIAVVPRNYAAYNNLGHELDRRGDFADAEAMYRTVLDLLPHDPIATNNLAVRLAARGEIDEARRLYREAIERDPTYTLAIVQLGNLYARQQRLDDAVMLYKQAIARNPAPPEAFHNYALVLAQRGDLRAAVELWRKALELNPEYADAHHGLGLALLMGGATDEGLSELRWALRLDPDRVDTLTRLAWVLATYRSDAVRNPAEALLLAEKAVAVSKRNDATALDTLAAVHAAAGRFSEAIRIAEEAEAVARGQGQAALEEQIAQRRRGYRDGKPFTQGR